MPRAHLGLAVAGGPGWWLWQMAVPLLMRWHVCDSLLGACLGPKAWSAESALSEELHGWELHTCGDTNQLIPAQHQAQKDGSTKRAALKRAVHAARLPNNVQREPGQHGAQQPHEPGCALGITLRTGLVEPPVWLHCRWLHSRSLHMCQQRCHLNSIEAIS